MRLDKYKCDRCGIEYIKPKDEPKIHIEIKESSKDGVIFYINSKGDELDVCPQCTESFQKWWKQC